MKAKLSREGLLVLLVGGTPVLVFLELTGFGWIAALVRQPSDLAVLAGVLALALFGLGNYLLVKLIVNQFKRTSS
ncbi:hypothetical protein GCM10027275_16790 [Rhabdobacter roseus]|uniref:ABC-type amino acid transport system permease subunit n=1 Tax=Rhabdobacter roseus TaxID=1655419 RepID=A0A840TQT7_9BACT|nr:hypothetical protein [Rhabdobacter roseus]MBB5283603.1 ABC-type amino acid transport system permease subunit [Rhabdobacter roseus]